jgi:hypothetical protein
MVGEERRAFVLSGMEEVERTRGKK